MSVINGVKDLLLTGYIRYVAQKSSSSESSAALRLSNFTEVLFCGSCELTLSSKPIKLSSDILPRIWPVCSIS